MELQQLHQDREFQAAAVLDRSRATVKGVRVPPTVLLSAEANSLERLTMEGILRLYNTNFESAVTGGIGEASHVVATLATEKTIMQNLTNQSGQ